MNLPLMASHVNETLINQRMQTPRELFGGSRACCTARPTICPYAISAVWVTCMMAPEHHQLGGTMDYHKYWSTALCPGHNSPLNWLQVQWRKPCLCCLLLIYNIILQDYGRNIAKMVNNAWLDKVVKLTQKEKFPVMASVLVRWRKSGWYIVLK